MSKSTEEIGDEFAQCMVCAMMNGAGAREAAEAVVAEFRDEMFGQRSYRRPSKPFSHRFDPSLATARLPDREWWPLRNYILERDEYRCVYCGDTDAPLCADHVVPLSRGGSNHPGNLVCCCIPCNSSKSDRLLSEWRGRN